MPSVEEFKLRKLTEHDINQVLTWRNSDRIRVNMYTDRLITVAEHQRWFHRIKDDATVSYCIVERQSRPIGLINFTQIDRRHSTCIWGFYLGETDLPRGSGTIMGYLAMKQAFQELKIRKVSGEVLDYNEGSLKLFRRLGFVEEGRKRQHVLKNGRYVDVIPFSLLADEWNGREKSRVEQLLQSYERHRSRVVTEEERRVLSNRPV